MQQEKKGELVSSESPQVRRIKDTAMKKSITEGSLSSVAGSLSGSYMTPYALAIGANTFHIGILSSFSGLVSPLGSLIGSRLMGKHSRKKIVMSAKSIEMFLWLPVIGLAYFAWKGIGSLALPYILIILFALLVFIGGLMGPAWFSWMGDLVPARIRGHYFAKRNRIAEFVGIIAFLIGSIVLDYFGGLSSPGSVLLGFSLLFIVGIGFWYGARKVMGGIYHPKFDFKKSDYFSFWTFIKRRDNFGKFAIFQALFFFSVMISAPFFAVYMLEDLGFSYLTFTLVSLSSSIFFLLFTPIVGNFSDTYGNVKLMYVAGFLFPFVPLLWIFLSSPVLLFLIPGLISGIANAAFILAVTDFTYDSVAPHQRGLSVAYMSVLTGLGVFGGALLGGYLIEFVNFSSYNPTFIVFIISTVLMFITSIIFLPQIKEVRKTKRLPFAFLHHHTPHHHHPFKPVHGQVIVFSKNSSKKRSS